MRGYLYSLLCIGLVIALPYNTKAQITANFSASTTSGCSPIVVNFTDLSTGTPTAWSWDLGNGATSTLQNPSTTYTTAGTYTVKLTASNASYTNTKTATAYITVLAAPAIAFVASDTASICAPKAITFTNNTVLGSSGSGTYTWDFGDGTSSSSTSPTHTYTTSGVYNVTLVATNSSGCSSTLVKSSYIHLNAKPHAAFGASGVSACNAPFTPTFSNSSTGAVSYSWSFGDGGSSTSTSPSHTYSSSGNYTVTLIATNSSGCNDTAVSVNYINVNNFHAAFSKSSSTACIGSVYTFTNTTTGGYSASAWYFGDGTTSTSASPTHSYAASGTYTVKLVVQNSSCIDSTTQTVTINSNPTVAFTADTTFFCHTPATVHFTNTSTGATSYIWSFGDTATNPSYTFSSTAIYNIRLTAISSAGCRDSLFKGGYIQLQALTSSITASPAGACLSSPVSFTTSVLSSTLSSYQWSFGDGSTNNTSLTPSHSYTTTGTYTVTFTYLTTSNCRDTATTTVIVSTKPTAGFSAPTGPFCTGTTITFTNSSTGATSYKWLFGDGATSTATSPNKSYTYSDSFSITLIASNNGCKDTLVKSKYIPVKGPTNAFGATINCGNRLNVTFPDSSTTGITYNWTFGDGGTSTSYSPSHTYSSYGVDTVRLTVSDGTCSVTRSLLLDLFTISSGFAAYDSNACKNSNIIFASPFTKGTSYYWDFGTGSSYAATTSKDTARYSYTSAGIYTTKLIVTDIYGCKDSTTKSNYVHVGGPNVNPTVSNACINSPAQFTDSTNDGGNSITSRLWSFGDGTTLGGNNSSPTHSYAVGTYDVKLIVTDTLGCKDSATKPALINITTPYSDFYTADTLVCPGHTVSFDNYTSGTSTYLWSFGDGGTSTGRFPSHTYTTSGIYTVRLVSTSSGGCIDTVTKSSYIRVGNLNLSFTMSDSFASCPPLTVNFTNHSSGITSYAWTFGNGSVSTLTNPSTIFTYPGVYTVKLKGTIAAGCSDSITKTVTINGPRGSLSYSPTAGCTPVTISFSSTDTGASSITWDMNNGVTSTSTISSSGSTTSTYSYTFTTSGKYVPLIVLSNGAGCNVYLRGVDTVKVDKIVSSFTFTPDSICGSGTVHFTDTATALSGITSRSWIFGDGGTSTAHNPNHIYTAAGTYTVKFIAGSANGCLDTQSKTVTIFSLPPVNAGADKYSCAGSGSVTLTATGAVSYSWTPSTGLSCTNCASPVATPSSTTSYIVTGTDSHGCTAKDTVVVNIYGVPTVSAGADRTICAGGSTTLAVTGASTYVWTPSTGLSCTACAGPVANPAVTTTYIVTGTDTNGCTARDTIVVNVNALPAINAGADKTICSGSSSTLSATGGTSYSWSPATGLSCTTCASPTASPTATTTYIVTGVDANGCTNKDTVIVNVNALPTVSAGPDKSTCGGSSVSLTATGATSYVWSPSTGLSCTACTSPTATPTATTTYYVTGTDANGCVNRDTIIVNVNPLPTVSAGPDKTICTGSSTTLSVTGASTYSWSPATGLSCTSCASPVASPTATTTYYVTGTDTHGCTNTDTIIVKVNALPSVNAGADKTICKGSSTGLSASGAATYSWSPTTGLSCSSCAAPTASPTTTTTYIVTGTDTNSCVNRDTVVVNVNALPTVNAGPDKSTCGGTSVSLSVTGATSYVWSPSTGLSCTACSSPTATPTVTTTYVVTGTDANGCVNTDTIIVSINSLPSVNAGPDKVICKGGSTTITASGATTYSWSPGTGLSCTACTSPTASPAITTTYVLTGTNASGCSGTDTVIVKVNPLPSVNAGADKTICTGSSVTLAVTGASAYSWSPTTGLSCSACAGPVASPTATTSYIVTGTDTNGCVNKDTVVVNVNAKPTVSAGPDKAICAGSSTTITASGAATYSWSPATGLSCTTCTTPTVSSSATTTYILTGTDSNGCVNTASVIITVNPLPAVSAGAPQSICKGSSATLGATGASTYVWSPVTGLSCTACAGPIANPTATTTYYVTGTDTHGCVNKDSVIITIKPLPVVSAGPDKIICKGFSATLKATGANTYVWSPATGLSCTACDSTITTPAAATTYTVTGTGANGCTNTSTVIVTVNQSPIIVVTHDTTICNGAHLQLNASGALTYVWSPGTSLSCTLCPDPVASPTSGITYSVTGTDINGCVGTGSVALTVINKTATTVGPGDTVCQGTPSQLSASGGTTYLWIPATGLSNANIANPTATPDSTTTYEVVIKQGNCFADTNRVTIVVNPVPVLQATGTQTIIAGNSAQLSASGKNIATYLWSPSETLSCADCSSPTATPGKTTKYNIIVTAPGGCTAQSDVTVTVKCDNSQLFIPNTFTPNGDGINDRFYPSGKGIGTIKRFSVYNRWGELLYQVDNMQINNPAQGWDGRFNGLQLKPDVFVYIVDATCESGEPLQVKGDVSIVR
ncbi:MAG: PKD domain-containing protein [Taibaiella sp.]|nr:PKD domain-containing protein [Taibaiella sp.]